jgi:hypothetical protein
MIWLAATALVLTSQPAPPGNVAAQQQIPVAHKLLRIRYGLDNGQLSSGDRAYVLEMFRGKFGSQRLSAFLCLTREVEHGLLSANQLMSLVQGQLKVVPGWEAAIYFLGTATYFCDLRGTSSTALPKDYARARAYEHDEKSIVTEERDLIVSMATSKSGLDRVLAASMMVAKRHLRAEAKAWALAQVNRQVKRSRGKERAVWEVVQRTVLVRNAS